ncbi:MAG: EF-P beta-lysylation protein EpmB [Aestuariibacter sp.]
MAQIIPKNLISVESHWQKELSQAFSCPESLLRYLEIPSEFLQQDIQARRLFPMRVPKAFADRMVKGMLDDPLLQQVLPRKEEFLEAPGFTADPLDEHDTPLKGILHKYQSRVLLMVRTGCAVNCRYCFRRHFPYQDHGVNKAQWQEVLTYIVQNPQINEVIFSGGDPLMAKDEALSWLAQEVAKIPHVHTLRIHTRLPVVIPNRICAELLNWVRNLDLNIVMVLHINHANEIDDTLIAKLAELKQAGVWLYNQAVLMAGVNASIEAMVNLNQRLFEAQVQPYYLHMLDRVKGAAHFAVSEQQAREIMAGVIKRQPGYLVPKLVREIGGQPGKTPVDLQLHP